MYKCLIIFLISTVLISTSEKSYSQNNNNLFFVFLNSNPDKENISEAEVSKLQSAHLENIEKLNKEGKLIAAGPVEGGGGMFILKADDLNMANEMLSTDPAIAANRFVVEVFPFYLYNGRICGAIEPYNMVTYQLVRLKTNNEDPNALGKSLVDNRLYMAKLQYETKQLVMHGKFGDDNDGVLILNVPDLNSAEEIMQNHQVVIDQQLEYDISTLWIAEGTFCEKNE